MPERAGERLKQYQEQTEEQDILALFPEENEKAETLEAKDNPVAGMSTEEIAGVIDVVESGRGNLTADRVARHWNNLSAVEKKFTLSSQGQFDSLIGKYEETHGETKANRIKALRKLILEKDWRASKIEP